MKLSLSVGIVSIAILLSFVPSANAIQVPGVEECGGTVAIYCDNTECSSNGMACASGRCILYVVGQQTWTHPCTV